MIFFCGLFWDLSEGIIDCFTAELDAESWIVKALMKEGWMLAHCLLVCGYHTKQGFQISQPDYRQRDLFRGKSGLTPLWSRF